MPIVGQKIFSEERPLSFWEDCRYGDFKVKFSQACAIYSDRRRTNRALSGKQTCSGKAIHATERILA